MKPTLSLYALAGIPRVGPGDDIFSLIDAAARSGDYRFADGDVLVLAQKIVSKSENRLVRLAEVTPSARAEALAVEIDKDPRLVELILRESSGVVRQRKGVIIVEHRLGYVHANAGIDRSNVEGEDTVLLLPENPDASAAALRARFRHELGIDLRVIINDSAGRAWREGTVGIALGTAGFEPVCNLIGKPDMLGRPMEVTTVGVADELAAAASLVMGQAAEGTPVVVVRGAALAASEGGSESLLRDRAMDLFR